MNRKYLNNSWIWASMSIWHEWDNNVLKLRYKERVGGREKIRKKSRLLTEFDIMVKVRGNRQLSHLSPLNFLILLSLHRSRRKIEIKTSKFAESNMYWESESLLPVNKNFKSAWYAVLIQWKLCKNKRFTHSVHLLFAVQEKVVGFDLWKVYLLRSCIPVIAAECEEETVCGRIITIVTCAWLVFLFLGGGGVGGWGRELHT